MNLEQFCLHLACVCVCVQTHTHQWYAHTHTPFGLFGIRVFFGSAFLSTNGLTNCVIMQINLKRAKTSTTNLICPGLCAESGQKVRWITWRIRFFLFPVHTQFPRIFFACLIKHCYCIQIYTERSTFRLCECFYRRQLRLWPIVRWYLADRFGTNRRTWARISPAGGWHAAFLHPNLAAYSAPCAGSDEHMESSWFV